MMKNNHHINEAKINDVCKCNDEKIKGKKYVIIFIKKKHQNTPLSAKKSSYTQKWSRKVVQHSNQLK